jgi:hypothetical protein
MKRAGLVMSVLVPVFLLFIFGYVGEDSRTWSKEGRREIREQLNQLARLTGGKTVFPSLATDCSQTATDMLNALRYRYSLGFYSSQPRPASLSSVQVRLRGERFEGWTVRWAEDIAM